MLLEDEVGTVEKKDDESTLDHARACAQKRWVGSDAPVEVAAAALDVASRVTELLEGAGVPPPLPPVLFAPLPLDPTDIAAIMHINRQSKQGAKHRLSGGPGPLDQIQQQQQQQLQQQFNHHQQQQQQQLQLRQQQQQQQPGRDETEYKSAPAMKLSVPLFNHQELLSQPLANMYVNLLYDPNGKFRFVCSQDGLRFSSDEALSEHLDYLFLKNKEKMSRGEEIVSRSWFSSVDQWQTDYGALATPGAGDGGHTSSGPGGGAAVECDVHKLSHPQDAEFSRCALSGELFEVSWDEDEQDEVYKGCAKLLCQKTLCGPYADLWGKAVVCEGSPVGTEVRYVLLSAAALEAMLRAATATSLALALEGVAEKSRADVAAYLATVGERSDTQSVFVMTAPTAAGGEEAEAKE
jgi:hypothetical protein